MDAFWKANNSKSKDLREWNHRWSDHHVFLNTWFFEFIWILKNVHHDVVGNIFGHKWKKAEYSDKLSLILNKF